LSTAAACLTKAASIKERKGEEEKAKMIDETVSLLLFSGDFIRPSSDAEMVAKTEACLL